MTPICRRAVVALFALLFSQSSWSAARSVHVVIKNNTTHTMIFVSGGTQHGIVTRRPPSRISSGGIGELFAESNGVATGTEGSVTYRLDGVGGNAVFHWDNPFVGSNSISGSAPAAFKIEQIGDTGNRTLVFFSIHDANQPEARCNAAWVIAHLGKHAEAGLDDFDRGIGFLTTPFKRLGIGGWVNTGCEATVTGTPVRDGQHSSDDFWTIDVRLRSFTIMGMRMPTSRPLFVRVEVEPKTAAHATGAAKAKQPIKFQGLVLIDTHHGDELVEVHPSDPILRTQ